MCQEGIFKLSIHCIRMGMFILVRHAPLHVPNLSCVPDVRLDNVFVNYQKDSENNQDDIRFTDVQLSDCGGTYHVDHKYAKQGVKIGGPVWRSPEVTLELPVGWTTATDILPFGLCVGLPPYELSLLANLTIL